MNFFDTMKTLTGNKPHVESVHPARQKTVLVVEDEPPLAKMLSESLQEEGVTVLTASNGQEGLALATKNPPDLVILDLLMPVMDGKEMLRQLRKIPQCDTIPVLILSNAGTVENIRETQFYSDADEFLIKSNVTMEEIVKKIKNKLLATRIGSV